MKLIAKFLTLLICFELIVAPFGTNIGIMNNVALAESCPTGQTFDANLNRCLTTDQAAQVLNATRNCGGDMDCYHTNATDQFNSKKGDLEFKEINRWTSGLTRAAALAVPILMAGALKDIKPTCSAISFGLIVAAGATMAISDIVINKGHYDDLRQIREDWGKVVKPSTATNDIDKQQELSFNAQSEAFQKLADAEGVMAETSSKKKTIYWIATAAYGVAAAVAALELVSAKWSPCKATPDANDPKPTPDAKDPKPTPKKSGIKTKATIHQITALNYNDQIFFNSAHKQFIYNIQNSRNFSELVINQKAIERTHSSPSIDDYKEITASLFEFDEIVKETPDAFQLFRTLSSKVLNELNPVQDVVAQDNDSNAAMSYDQDGGAFKNWEFLAAGTLLPGLAILFKKVRGSLSKWMITPTGRLVASGVLGLSTMGLAIHAGNVQENANARKDKLLELKAEFDVAAGAIDTCKSEDRDNPGKPNCYCYTPKNQRNPNRYNSQVCSRLWGGANVNFKKAANYSSDQKICMTKTYNPDPLCSCRKTASCLKSSVGKMQGISAGTLTMLNSGLGPMNSLTSGDASLGQIGSTNPGSTAIRMLSAVDKLLDSKPMAKHKALLDKGAKELTTSMNQAAAQIPQQSLASSGSGALPTNAKEAARMLEKELAPPSTANAVDGNQGTIATPTGSEEKMPEFGLTEEQAAIQESQIAEVMDKNLDYSGTDINNAPSANIFEVLTNRYQRSGMRRLFDENNTTPAEAPSKSDINK